MPSLLLVVGPTATGKTSLALQLSAKFGGELLSADSRQVYKSMDIGTGKDIPKKLKAQNSKLKFQGGRIPFYGNGTKIWGYDLVYPDDQFSVAHYQKIAVRVLDDIWKRGKLPIIVGGTGLYIQAVTESMPAIGIPPDNKLRQKLAGFSLESLQRLLKDTSCIRYRRMGSSDCQNPRRLIRAIEIEAAIERGKDRSGDRRGRVRRKMQKLWIGLTAPNHVLYRRIDERVIGRLRQGAEREVRGLMRKGYDLSLPAMSASGYKQWQPYLEGQGTKKEVIKRWKLDEHAYARRQLTWFRKNKEIRWFDISIPGYARRVVRAVTQWYSDS